MDGSELVLRECEDLVDFLARDGRRQQASLRGVRLAGPKNSVAKRVQYATTLLHSRGGVGGGGGGGGVGSTGGAAVGPGAGAGPGGGGGGGAGKRWA